MREFLITVVLLLAVAAVMAVAFGIIVGLLQWALP